MDELLKKKSIEEQKMAETSEEVNMNSFEMSAFETQNAESREKSLRDALNKVNSSKNAKKNLLEVANETLKNFLPGVPKEIKIVSGMSDGAVITVPPRPVALKRR